LASRPEHFSLPDMLYHQGGDKRSASVNLTGGYMRRSFVNKHKSARKFRSQVGRTKIANMRGPMRGGIRF